MGTLLQDLRYALRNLVKAPAFTVIALATLALGIGANTAIFSVVDAVLLRALPYFQPDRLVVVLHDGRNPVAPANFLDWQRDNHVFEQMGAAELWSPNLTNVDTPEQVPGIRVTQEIFPLLGVRPALGRTFSADEAQSGKDHEIVLSYGLWRRRFGGDASALGRTLSLNGETYTVIGVMPQAFRFAPFWATHAQMWAPLALDKRLTSRTGNSLRIFARLKPGVTLDQARAEVATITGRLEVQFPGTNQRVSVVPLKEKVVGDVRPALLVLLGAVGFVLLIACANIAHMLLARASARQREVAVRTALGASRSRLVRQLLTESTLLAMVGGVFGLLLAKWSTHALLALSPQSISQFSGVSLDARVVLFTFAISILTGLLFGLAPALQLTVMNVAESLKEGSRGSGQGMRSSRMRSLLISSEFALAVVLLAGAGLMIRTFVALQAIDPGFNPQHLITMVVSVAGTENAAAGKRATFYQQVIDQVQAQRGVQSVSAINHLPLGGDVWGLSFAVEGRPPSRPGEGPGAAYRVVLPQYFHAMNIPILRGRDVTAADNTNAPGAVIVNEFLAKRYWPGEDPIGKRISVGDPTKPSWLTIVGVVKNVVRSEWSAAPEEEVYVPFLQDKFYLSDPSAHAAYLTLVVRTTGDPKAATGSLESTIHTLDKNATISQVATMDDVVAEANAQPRFYLLLLGSFAALALALAAVGIYGVMSHSVSRRTHEMAVRMALGARQSDVLRLVVGESMLLAAIGGAIGIVAALALTPLMSSLLYGTRAADPLTFAAVATVLGLVALLASYVPARRATKVDPVVALRYE